MNEKFNVDDKQITNSIEEYQNKSNENNENNEKLLPRNIVREYSKKISPQLKKWIGNYYSLLHYLIIMLGCFVLFFSNNILYLCALLNMIILDCMSIVFIHDCPLTMLEKRYLGTSCVEARENTLKEMGIVYDCNHEYEKQLELLINLWSFIGLKILLIIIMNMFHLQLK